ncbi:hypothetical protein EDB86DRAFT_2836072 [Lactarius hatsudake]|nr:hypothetical protein EDB86DRAFT_2836072 [Lactarius hatsudake]
MSALTMPPPCCSFPFSPQADNFMVCNPYKPLEAENKSLPPDMGCDWDSTVRVHGDISNVPSSPSPEGPQTALQLQLQQVQAQLAMLMAAIAGGNGGGVAPSPITILGNSRSLCFEKQSIPNPPLVSFARDLPWLMRTWDDSSPKWTPLEVVLCIQGELIALKHWLTVYHYSKSGQWACTKKNWAHWQDITMSWQELTETSFWQKFVEVGICC